MALNDQPFAVDGTVSREKLEELLSLGAEHSSLDYKRQCDLTKGSRSRLDFVKDCAALMSEPNGGYLVIGVDDQGRPLQGEPPADLALFDSARLTDLLEQYIRQPHVTSAVYDVDGVAVVLIYLGPPRDAMPAIILKDGEHGGRLVFRQGDVWVRRNSQNRRWQPEDAPRVLDSFARGIREEERQRINEYIEHLQPALRGAAMANMPLNALTWRLPAEDFAAAVGELARRDDLGPLRVFALAVVNEVRQMPDTAAAEVTTVLDRLAAGLATCVVLEKREAFDVLNEALYQVFLLGAGAGGGVDSVQAPRLWRDIAARVEGLGGLAVRMRAWWAVRALALRAIPWAYGAGPTWLRAAVTSASRANLLTSQEGKPIQGALVAFARAAAAEAPALRPDLPDDAQTGADPGAAPATDDPILDSICQFDFLWCTLVVVEANHNDALRENFYPSCGAYYTNRTEPIIVLYANDPAVRAAIFGQASNEEVRAATATVLDGTRRVGDHFWRDWPESQQVQDYVNDQS